VIRCLVLVCNPTNIWETWNVHETDNLIRDLAEYVKRGMVLFEAISIDCRRERDLLAQVSDHLGCGTPRSIVKPHNVAIKSIIMRRGGYFPKRLRAIGSNSSYKMDWFLESHC
jgi:hypothetical protein